MITYDCYALCFTKPVVGTSEKVAEQDFDVIKMAFILNINTILLCLIISIIVGRFQNIRYQNVTHWPLTSKQMTELNNDVNKMVYILNMNDNAYHRYIRIPLVLDVQALHTNNSLQNDIFKCL